MPKTYLIPAGTVYPATLAGYKLAKARRLDEVDWVTPSAEDQFIEAPYPEIVPSWLANGIEEASAPAADSQTEAPAEEVSE
jgi:hypothetical protein